VTRRERCGASPQSAEHQQFISISGLAESAPAAIPFHSISWDVDYSAIAASLTGDETPKIERFLREWLKIEPTAFFAAVGSGRSALRLALSALAKTKQGRETIVVPSYCCGALVDPIVECGLVPRFLDIGPELISTPEQYLNAIDESTLCVVLVHLCGKRLGDDHRQQILEACRRRRVYSVDDNCNYLWPMPQDLRADVEFFSFGFGKTLTATAGGALVSRVAHEELIEEFGRYWTQDEDAVKIRYEYLVGEYGGRSVSPEVAARYKSRQSQFNTVTMANLDMWLVLQQSHHLGKTIRIQIKHGERLHRLVMKYPHLFLSQGLDNNMFMRFPLIFRDVETFNRFWTHMHYWRIGLEGMYRPLHLRHPKLHKGGILKAAESVYPRVFNVPNRPGLRRRELARICEALDAFGQQEMSCSA
jgi:dTDP-4-amino-4,6-dideoxygalactose transaminase